MTNQVVFMLIEACGMYGLDEDDSSDLEWTE